MARSKKEIDKELMYKKLMPTAQSASDGDTAEPAAPPKPEANEQPQQAGAEPPAAVPASSPPSPAPAAKAQPADAPKAPSAASALVSGIAPEEPQAEIVNVMELLVDARIDAAMEKFRCCNCDKCRKDVTAITLNKLVPCYIVSSDTVKRAEIESKFAGQVATALVQAILTVKARPTHD